MGSGRGKGGGAGVERLGSRTGKVKRREKGVKWKRKGREVEERWEVGEERVVGEQERKGWEAGEERLRSRRGKSVKWKRKEWEAKEEMVGSERGKGGKRSYIRRWNTSRNKNPKCFFTCI